MRMPRKLTEAQVCVRAAIRIGEYQSAKSGEINLYLAIIAPTKRNAVLQACVLNCVEIVAHAAER